MVRDGGSVSIAPGRLESAPHYGRHGALPDYRDHQPPPATAEETAETLERITLEDLRNDDAMRWHMERNARLRDMGLAHTIEPVRAPLPPPKSHAEHLAARERELRAKVVEFQASSAAARSAFAEVGRVRSFQQRMAEQMEPFPFHIRQALHRKHTVIENDRGAVAADEYLAAFCTLHGSPLVDWRAGDDDLRRIAKGHAQRFAVQLPGLIARNPRAIKPRHRLALDAKQTAKQRRMRAYLAFFAQVQAIGLEPPKPRGNGTPEGCCRRLTGTEWWNRKLLRWQQQGLEIMARSLGMIGAHAGYALSNEGENRLRHRRSKTMDMLAEFEAVSDDGDVLQLLDLIKKGPANAYIRFVELMVRVRGMSSLADSKGYEGWFITWTLPSSYHSHYKHGGANPRYNPEHTTAVAKETLQGQWTRTRARAAKKTKFRNKLRWFGQRGAEPHHDSCPHWHLLVFVHPADREQLFAMMRHEAFREDGDEPGAAEVRWQAKLIDRDENGALKAAGYIAKYLAKNLTGAHLGQEFRSRDAETGELFPLEDELATDVVLRVNAWASVWRTRQFQLFGVAPVGIWRELRRLGDAVQADPLIEAARLAANKSDFDPKWHPPLPWRQPDFGAFTEIIGGWCHITNGPAPRSQLQLVLDFAADERVNRYGEPRIAEKRGLIVMRPGPAPTLDLRQIARMPLASVATRRTRWTIRRRAVAGPWSRVTNCNRPAPEPDSRPDFRPPLPVVRPVIDPDFESYG